MVIIELPARSAGINNFAIWRKYLRLEHSRWKFGHGHKRCPHAKTIIDVAIPPKAAIRERFANLSLAQFAPQGFGPMRI